MVPSDRLAKSPRRWALSAWASLGLVCALSLELSPTILPSDDLGLAGFRTPEVTRSMQLGQTFEINADGLHAIEFYPAAADRPVSGMLRLQLVDTTGPDEASLAATWIALGIALLASCAIWNSSPASTPQPTAAAGHTVAG